MAAKVSSLTGMLTVNVSGWTAGFKQAAKEATAFQKALKPVTDVTSAVGKSLAVTGTLVGGALLGMAKSAANFGDALLDASKRTGMSTESLASFKLLADQSGTSFETLSKGVNFLGKQMVGAATGNKEATKTFKALGISVKDAQGNMKTNSAVMEEIADKFANMEDGALKTTLAQRAFSKSGAEMIPLLNEGSEGFRRAREQADKFGISMSRAEAELGDKFNDSLAETKAAMQGFANAVGVALLPQLTELVNKANDWIAAASKWTKAHPELTLAIAKTSAALVGAGGLLVGLSGVATMAPKVVSGLSLIAGGFKSAMTSVIAYKTAVAASVAATKAAPALAAAEIAAASAGISLAQAKVLTAGKSASTASALFTLLGAKVSAVGTAFTKLLPVITKVGGLIGAIYLTKQISDWTGYTKVVMDTAAAFQRFISVVSELAGHWAKIVAREVVTFFSDLASSVNTLVSDLPVISGFFRQIGEWLDSFSSKSERAQLAWDSFINGFLPVRAIGQGLNAASDLLQSYIPPSSKQFERLAPTLSGAALEAFEKGNPELRKKKPGGAGALGGLGDEADQEAKRLKALSEAFSDTLRPADEWHQKLKDIRATVKGVTDADIINAYGDQILAASQAQRDHGFEIDKSVLDLAKQVAWMKEVQAAQAGIAAGWAEVTTKMEEEREAFRKMGPAADILGGAEIEIKRSPAAQAQIDEIRRRGEITNRITEQADEVRQLAADMVRLQREGKTTAQIEAALGVRMEDVLERARELGVGLDGLTRKTLDQAARAQNLERSWGDTFASISDGIVDAIIDFKNFGSRVKDIGLDTAKSLGRSFLDGAFKPIKEGLHSLGEEAGKWASGLLFGVKKTTKDTEESTGGLLGGLLGNAGGLLSGLFGGKKGGGNSVTDIITQNVLGGLEMPGLLKGPVGGGGSLLGGIFGGEGPWSERIFGKGGLGGIFGGGGQGGAQQGMQGMMSSLPGEGYAYAAGKVIDVVQGGWKPGQKAQDVLSDLENNFVKSVLSIVDDPELRAVNKEKIITNLWEGIQSRLTQMSGVDKNFAKATAGASSNLNAFIAERFRDLAPHLAIERAPGYIDPATGQLMNAAASSGGPDFAPFTTAVSDFSMAVEKFSAKAIPAANAGEIPSLALGGLLKKSGLVMAHAGEVVMPLATLRDKLFGRKDSSFTDAIAGIFANKGEASAEIRPSMGAAIAAILGKSDNAASGSGDTHNHYEINLNIDRVENYDDFIAKIASNHHGGAEIIGRKVLKVVPALMSS